MSRLLHVENLCVQFGSLRAVDDVSFELGRGEILGLVGESGSGKSTTGRAILQLLRPTSGHVTFDGQELTSLWKKRFGSYMWGEELRRLRRRMQIIFQDPYSSLNPRLTIEQIVAEPLQTFAPRRGMQWRDKIAELLTTVGLDPRYMRRFPHEFSGGQRQRIGIARALALDPDLIIADEPISALDVSIQAQILNLLKDIQKARKLSMIFIGHDLAAVRHLSQRIAVMYGGKIVEINDGQQLFLDPQHAYTRTLIAAAR